MSNIDRRNFLKMSAGLAAGAATGKVLAQDKKAAAKPAAGVPTLNLKPEKGAKLRVLRWKRFIQGDEDAWLANTKKFTQKTGIEVRVDSENLGDVGPKSAVAANIGHGPDLVLSTFDDAHLYPDKLVDVTDVANYLGAKYGGWYDTAKAYGTVQSKGNKWIALPMGCTGSVLVYRESHVKAAGFSTVPKDTDGFLKMMQAMKAKGTPGGFALGNATGDGNLWTHWLLWAFGGKMVDAKNNVVINSPETIKALEYGKELYQTFIPGTLSWLDPNNNKAFLDGQISVTGSAASIYFSAKNSADPKQKEMALDMQHVNMPIGPVGRPMQPNFIFQMMVFKYSKYPNAAKEYVRFMMEKEQYEAWMQGAAGYVTQSLKAYASHPIWTSDPKLTPYRDAMAVMTPNGYAGALGYASAAAMADFIVVNMVAEAASGAKTPKEAAERAEMRAQRYYKV